MNSYFLVVNTLLLCIRTENRFIYTKYFLTKIFCVAHRKNLKSCFPKVIWYKSFISCRLKKVRHLFCLTCPKRPFVNLKKMLWQKGHFLIFIENVCISQEKTYNYFGSTTEIRSIFTLISSYIFLIKIK